MREQVVLVDESGVATGVADKATVHTDSTPLHLAFSCYVINPDGLLLLTTRADGKTFPGVLTNSFCGHPAPDESIEDAVRRRAQDELGITLQIVRLILPDFRYRAEMNGVVENELCPVLVASSADEPTPRADEASSTEWVSWSALRDDVLAGRREVSPWFAEQIALLADLDNDPLSWPAGDRAQLPPALR